MKTHFFFLLSGLFLIVFFWADHTTTGNASDRLGALFPEMKPWELKAMSLSDDAGNELIFKRIMCVWKVGEENLPTNEVKVSALADALLGLHSSKVGGKGDSTFADFRVDENAYDLKVTVEAGESSRVSVYFGKGKKVRTAYARFQQGEEVHLVEGIDLDEIHLQEKVWQTES